MLYWFIALTLLNIGDIKKAPDFRFEYISGSIGQLSEYKGQVVYISFWASWCAPCITNFQAYRETRKAIEDSGVILLNVSIDTDADAWMGALEKYPFLNGKNVRAIDRDHLMYSYNLSSIPAYEIVNKKGLLVYLPEDGIRDIIKEFDALVKQ